MWGLRSQPGAAQTQPLAPCLSGHSSRAIDPLPSWARRKHLGASPPFPMGETEAREVESYSFSGETLISLHPGFLIHASFTSRDFFFFLIWGVGTGQLEIDFFVPNLATSIDVAFISLTCPLSSYTTLCPSAKCSQPRPPSVPPG